jgi:Bacterial archaeo-eukaryotic release factor family 3
VHIICNLDYNTHKKSVAILVSSEEWKTFYLDINAEEKVFITNSFQIRQIVRHQKDDKEFLLVVLHNNYAAVYRGQGQTISMLLQNVPDYQRKVEKTDQSGYHIPGGMISQQTLFHKFLLQTDKSLSLLLNAFSLPVLVLSSRSIIDIFLKITQNHDFIAGLIEGNTNNLSEDEIEKMIQSNIHDWQKVKERFLLHQLERAMEVGKLEAGIEDVWSLAKRKNVKLLVVEEGYKYKAFLGKGHIVSAEEASSSAYIKDAVEDAIEKVLADGGKVVCVGDGVLNHFMHIAAIKSY